MKTISLASGRSVTIDDADFDWLSKSHWIDNGGYAYRARGGHANRVKTYMHREIMSAPVGMEVDHIDGDGYNNSRSNLRVVTHAQNLRNSKRHKDNKSGYKGVRLSTSGKWAAEIYLNGRHNFLGNFETAIEAAHAYDKAASQAFGNIARINGI